MHGRLVIAKKQIITNNRTELRLKVGIFWDLWSWAAEKIDATEMSLKTFFAD